ncbi:MAG TPA: alpha/beta hydrolase [Steroidobacteraceae bacterium]|nr:alpha/beta hydrolase [Steroidobacteraceae bacterium]
MPPPRATADRYLSVAGARLRYRDEGRGPAVLLVHGWTLDLEMWEPQIAGLGGSFRLVRLDRRGFGLSTGRASLTADVRDALALCDRLQLERLACVGMSQGARVALQLCRIAAERLSCVVLDGPPRGLAGEAAEQTGDVPLAEYRSLIARGGIEAFRRRWASHPLMQLENGTARARALLGRMTARYSGKDLLQRWPAPRDPWNSAVTASLRTPALILTGEHDLPARVRAADALAGALPFAERAIIAAARHLPNLDNPPLYNTVLRAFLERHAGSPS